MKTTTQIELSESAQQNVEETNTDVQQDIKELQEGSIAPAALLAKCFDGAADDRLAGWAEYVSAVTEAARK